MKKPSDTLHTLLALLAAAVLMRLIPVFFSGAGSDLPRIYAAQGTITLLCFGVWPVLLKIRKWPHNNAHRKDSFLLLAGSALLGVICQTALGILTEFWTERTGIARDPGIPIPSTFAEWAAALMILTLLPALAEEAFFRGMMLRGLGEVMPTMPAAAVTTVIFAVAHLSLAALPALLVFGAVASVLAIKGGKLKYSIAFHLAYNLTALILSAI